MLIHDTKEYGHTMNHTVYAVLLQVLHSDGIITQNIINKLRKLRDVAYLS